MNIRAKLIISLVAVAFVPCALMLVLGLVRGQVDPLALAICGISLLIAIGVAVLLARTLSLPFADFAQYLNELSVGTVEASVSDRTYRAATEYANLASLLSATMVKLGNTHAELEQQLDERAHELDETVHALTATKEEVERLNNVTIDRELKMIEIKASLREARKRLGEPTQTPVAAEEVPAEEYHDPEQGRAAMLNILDDLQTEKKLLATEKAKDDAILRSIGDGIVVADGRGTITFLNENARTLLDLSEVDNESNTWAQLPTMLDPKTNKPLAIEELPLYKAVQGQSVVKQALLIQDEEIPEGRWVEMTATPIMVAGMPLGGVATLRDVTKEQQVDRAKTEFVSLASHQLRTPLSSINWYAEMLLAGDAGELNDEQRTYLDEVYQGNQRMVDLINSLLNVSRLELGTLAVDPEDTDVIALAQSVLNELAPEIKHRDINLETTLDPTTPHMLADPKLLRMVFQNLASNAVKYTPIGGSVSVQVVPDGDDITITVADTGLGIPKTEQSRIFSKLFRATNARESDTDGTGLGLYIVKSVIEHAGGTIEFTSEEGKGTTFYVRLPKSGMKEKAGTKSLS
jgi:two-component system phosphate regulon sensor histidine kinase PhoR